MIMKNSVMTKWGLTNVVSATMNKSKGQNENALSKIENGVPAIVGWKNESNSSNSSCSRQVWNEFSSRKFQMPIK